MEMPEGWKLVPIEITDEMIDAGEKALAASGDPILAIINVYLALIAAAPEPPLD